jgi:hypothetical protein
VRQHDSKGSPRRGDGVGAATQCELRARRRDGQFNRSASRAGKMIERTLPLRQNLNH